MRRSKPATRKQCGFSLIELLIVMAIILILIAIAIPSFTGLTARAHETSAIGSIRAINNAQIMYQSTYPQNGFACTLPSLGTQNGTAAGPNSAALIGNTQLLSGVKDGYTFTMTCTRATGTGGTTNTSGSPDSNATATSYLVVAAPVTPGKSGTRYFCSDNPSSIHYSMTPNCNPDSDPTI
ncbi:MAG: type II secretion system protein [Acidobacteriaceae bacterium]